jgi:Malectin domain/Viral BACON domain
MERFFSWKAGWKVLGVGALLAATLVAAAAQTVNLKCGGQAFTTSDGTQWSGDSYFNGGDLLYTGYSIASTQPQDFYLYRSARAGLYGDFSYSIPLPNGTYTVNLMFAEIQYTTKGDRVFNVAINGTTVLSNFDILANVPVLTPLTKQFTASVTNGVLSIAFTGVTRKGLINAIQVAPATGSGTSSGAGSGSGSGGSSGSGSGSGSGTSTGTPSVAVSSNALSFAAAVFGSSPAPQTVTVSNAGGGTLNWTATSTQSWLWASPSTGTNTGNMTIFANLAPLGVGTYTGVITVQGGGSSKSITAVFTVSAASAPLTPPPAAASLAVSTTSLSFVGTAGSSNPAAQGVAVSNAGGGTLSWSASSNQNWLSVSPSSGTNSGTLSIGANLAGLGAGNYSGAVTVNGGAAGAKTVNVSFAVAAASSTPPPVTPPPVTPPPVTLPPVTLPSGGNNWFVTTSGSSSGDGSAAHPWDLVTALAGPRSVMPGDTIWLRAGKYGTGQFNSVVYSTLVGTPSAPIIVRAYPGERVTIDEWLEVGCCDGAPNPAAGSYTWFWGLEFAGFNPDRTTGSSGPPSYGAGANHNSADTWGPGTKFINCIVHDTGGGLSVWSAANSELTGNIVYNVGGYGPDRGHGHLFYLQNQAPSVVALNDNIGFNNFDMGLQAYGSSPGPYVQNMTFNGNVIFNSGILYGQRADNITIGGGTGGPSGMVLSNNVFYNPPTATDGYNELGFLWTPRAGDVVATGNYFIGGNQAIDMERWQSVVFQNNTIYNQGSDESMWILASGESTGNYQVGSNHYFGNGHFTLYTSCDYWPCGSGQGMGFATFQGSLGLDLSSTYSSGGPTGVQTLVRPNAYEPGRANVVIFNWNMQGSVQVDLSASGIKAGDSYQIRDAQNWFGGPVVSGTYSGAPVTIPMTGLALAQPVGSVPNRATHTAPLFGTFVLLSGTALTNAY